MAPMMRPRPHVLHLCSDWRWTAAAESAVNLCRQLRRLGFPVDLACPRASTGYPDSLEHHAREHRIEPILDFALDGESRSPFAALADVRAVAEFMDREEVQIVHVHAGYDHYVGSRAARKINSRPFVVRTNHTGAPLPNGLLARWLVRGHTDAWVAPARAVLDSDAANFGISPAHGIVVRETPEVGEPPSGAVEESSEHISVEGHVEAVAELYLRLVE